MSTPDNTPIPSIYGKPTATNRLAEDLWREIEATGEDGASSDYLLQQMFCTVSQLRRSLGYARDITTLVHGKALPSVRGVYLTSTDLNLIAEYVGWRLRGIDRELRRLRTGATLPLGDQVAAHAVLSYYDGEIVRMLQVTEELKKVGFPVQAMPAGSI